ncbi:unnamed protein product, partial [Laminaria digitata]
MTFRGKEFRALSPKKVSRRKRTPRCDSCGKRDGEEARTEPGEESRKVRLKLCARCRAVAYCGMECQKAGWKRHREVCVKYVNAADLPPPSPLVNHKNTSGAGGRGRRKIIYGGNVNTLAPTPRQRENAPTRHPFFGRQESTEQREVNGGAAAAPAAPPATVAKQREQEQQTKLSLEHQRQQQHQQQYQQLGQLQQLQQKHQQEHQQEQEQQQQQRRVRQVQRLSGGQGASREDGCPSPPTMKRLSMPGGGGGGGGGGSRSRLGSRSSSGSTGGKRSPIEGSSGATTTTTMTGMASISPTLDTLNPAVVFHTASPDQRRLIISPAASASRDRRSSYVPPPPPPQPQPQPPPPNGVSSRGGVSPPDPIPSHEAYFSANAASSSSIPSRRVSAPLFPASLEESRRRQLQLEAKRSSLPTTTTAAAAAASGASTTTRGPPPPYALVAHRANSFRSTSSPLSDAREKRAASASSVITCVTTAASITSGSPLQEHSDSPSAPPSLPAPIL